MGKKAAFSSELRFFENSDKPHAMTYDHDLCPCDYWDKTTFTAPKDGLYLFALSFVKEGTGAWTNEDVQVRIHVNDDFRDGAFAWAGQGAKGRYEASVTVIIPLEKGDEVTTWDWSDQNLPRKIQHVVFTGYRVAKT